MTTDTLRPEMFAIGQVRLYPTWKSATVNALTSVINDYHFGEEELEKVVLHVPNFMFKYVKQDDTYDMATRLHCRLDGLRRIIRYIEVEQHHNHVVVTIIKDFGMSWTDTISQVIGNIAWFCNRSTWEPHYR
ncbi:MAG: hypothetical protein EOP04_13815 [Proteobacteria bacterium]|nr:MAG: hypothetical protein EOP04_13815 [Pseudomonadota bacterium]